MPSLHQQSSKIKKSVVRTSLERARNDVQADRNHEARVLLSEARAKPHAVAYHPLCAQPFEIGDPTIKWWSPPPAGGESGAHEAGKFLALDFLKYLRDSADDSMAPKSLSFVFNGMAFNLMKALGHDWKATAPEDIPPDVFNVIAQIGGFCSVIGQWSQAAAKELGHDLDRSSQEEIAVIVSRLLDGEVAA